VASAEGFGVESRPEIEEWAQGGGAGDGAALPLVVEFTVVGRVQTKCAPAAELQKDKLR